MMPDGQYRDLVDQQRPPQLGDEPRPEGREVDGDAVVDAIVAQGSPASARAASGGPVRTCIGCRSRDAQANLVRIAAADGRVVVDLRRRMPGRGVYVHQRPECLEQATQKGRLGRALRARLHPSHTAALRQLVIDALGSDSPLRERRSKRALEPVQSPPREVEDGSGEGGRRAEREPSWLTPPRLSVEETRQARGQ